MFKSFSKYIFFVIKIIITMNSVLNSINRELDKLLNYVDNPKDLNINSLQEISLKSLNHIKNQLNSIEKLKKPSLPTFANTQLYESRSVQDNNISSPSRTNISPQTKTNISSQPKTNISPQ